MKRQRRNQKGQAFLIAEAYTFDRTERELARDLAEMLRAWGSKRRASRQKAARPTEADMERSMRAAEEAAKRVAARRRHGG